MLRAWQFHVADTNNGDQRMLYWLPTGCIPSVPNVDRFGFSMLIDFTIHLDIHYIFICSEQYKFRKIKMNYIFETERVHRNSERNHVVVFFPLIWHG
jgi:hypothetical protein